MALTTLSNLINPQVMADMISAGLPQAIKFAPLATIDTTLVAQPGNTVSIPTFAYIGDAVDVAEGIAIGTVQLTASTTQATVKKVGQGVDLSDESLLSAQGDIVGQTNTQLMMSVASKIDADCVTALAAATLTFDGSAAIIGYNGVVDAVDKFQEEDYEQKYMFIHPTQASQLRKDADFKDINRYPINTVMSGVIGEICGCHVITSKRVPVNATVYTNYIVKAGAFTIFMKRDVQVETGRDISKKVTSIYVDEHYTVVLSDASKVVKATFKK
jgi:N4-gp56 family major capsid protein